MYGTPGRYFGEKQQGFHNSVWIELIGFDKDARDCGVQDFLNTLGFTPDSVSFHLTSVDFVNTHRGMEEEYVLPRYACSYCGRAANDQRDRQDWTNYDMRRLIEQLHSHGVQTFASFFDFGHVGAQSPFVLAHPEICANGNPNSTLIMIKRFSDGTYYEDFLLRKMIQTAKDYKLDGIQIADGLSSLRQHLWYADFSADLLEQAGMEIPDGQNPQDYISKYKRAEWIAFYRRRWAAFLKKLIGGLKDAGILTAVNSAWTRDPLEAIFRYGADYRAIEEAGADFLVVEDVSSDLAILEGETLDYPARKLVHYEFLANLMAINAYIGTHITPLFMIWDNQEQWDVIHHMPTAMQRAAAANFTHFSLRGGHLTPITGGPHFCLGDGLTPAEWDFIRLAIDNGYTPEAVDAAGATFLWSSARMEKELEMLLRFGRVHSARWLALLMRHGAAIAKIADISQLHQLTGDIVVANYDLLPECEQKIVDAYNGGRVIQVGQQPEQDVSHEINPATNQGWTVPLTFAPVPEEDIFNAVKLINASVNAVIAEGKGERECTLNEVFTGTNTSRILVDNNEYYYVLPTVKTKRKIRQIRIITKPEKYPVLWSEHEFRLRVPGRGIEIAELEYE